MVTFERETVTDDFRRTLLAAWDEAAGRQFRDRGLPAAQRNDVGATDADLPALFKEIDAHLARLCARYDVRLED